MQEKRIKPGTVFMVIGFALAAFMILGYGLSVVLGLVAGKNMPMLLFLRDNQVVDLLINYACIYGIGFIVYYLIIRKLPHTLPGYQTFSFKELFQFFCIGYALAITSNVIGTFISLISGNKTNITSAISNMVDSGGIASGVIMIIVAPAVEELIFRKIIIDRTKKYGEKYAIVFSAICFGLFHMNLQQFLYATAIGLVFGYVYSKSGKIQYTMIMHSIINAIGYLVVLIAAPMLESMNNISIESIIKGDITSLQTSFDMSSMMIILIAEQLILAIIVMGIIFFIIKVRRLRFDYSSPECLQKKNVFRTIYINVGVILFVLICIAGMVLSFMGGIKAVLGS